MFILIYNLRAYNSLKGAKNENIYQRKIQYQDDVGIGFKTW